MTLWILLIGVPLLVGLWAQMRVSSAFSHWKQVAASSGVTGAQAAREILAAANIRDVEVVEINDMLGDHYDPTHKRLCLSTEVYRTPSVAALGIAAHECGHAIQHQKAYAPLQWRMAIVPITQIASNMLPFIFLGGLFFGIFKLAMLAVGVYLILTLFQLITLPVEFDASRRAKIILQQMGMIRPGEEAAGVNNVLNAAALTYVAAFVASLGTLIYYLLILTGHRGDER
jgi:Zn-dependent membrane protease YugP